MQKSKLDKPTSVMKKLSAYLELTRMHKPVGILLLLWPTLWALWLAARGVPDATILVVFVAGTILMRAAGCAINDYADRHFDGHVTRTRDRPIVSGRIEPREALFVGAILMGLSGLLVLSMNHLTILLSLVAIPLAILYPFMKRYTYLPQVYLAAAFSWGIPMAFAAVSEEVPLLAWLLMCANILWVLIYDTEYAMTDRHDDLKVGVRSTAILLGDLDRSFILVCQVLLLINLFMIGARTELHWPYLIALAGAAACCAYQQYLIRTRTPRQCFAAFMNNIWLGGFVWLGLVAEFFFFKN